MLLNTLVKDFREVVFHSLELENNVTGCKDITVEIDDVKFGKQNYHLGHAVEGIWVLGGVERTPERKVFLIQVENRSAKLLTRLTQEHVKKGSIIHTYLWRGYNMLEQSGYDHLTVNHSQNFKDPITGVHTTIIECTWNALEMQVKPRNRTKYPIDGHLWKFIWQRTNLLNLGNAFMNALRQFNP